MRPAACRRRHNRFAVGPDDGARVEFRFPDPGGEPCVMPLRDVSSAGLSMTLARELPGLDTGSSLDGATVTIGARRLEGDLLVMHVTPGPETGAICGALFYPRTDRDILERRGLLQELEARETSSPVEAPLALARAD